MNNITIIAILVGVEWLKELPLIEYEPKIYTNPF